MAASGSKQCKPMKTYIESLSCRKKKWCTWTVLLRLMFLDSEYSSEVLQILLAVPITLHEKARGVLKKRRFWKFRKPKVFTCEFCGIFKNTFFHRTPPVDPYEKLKTKAVVRRFSVKKLFLEIHRKIVVPVFFYSLINATLLKWSLWHKPFPVNFASTFLLTPFLQNASGGCSCKSLQLY